MAALNTIGGIHYEMMRRCYNEKSVMYPTYGAVGIEVCKEWHNREEFKKWAKENGYVKGLRLERIDSSKNYEPENCRFGTRSKKFNSKTQKQKSLRNHRMNLKIICGVPQKYSKTRLYRIYIAMHRRCEDELNTNYKHYGGRGISVCKEWSGKDGFFYFYKWAMENGYSDELSIDRINNDKGYSPSNCRWATATEQNSNRRCCKKKL